MTTLFLHPGGVFLKRLAIVLTILCMLFGSCDRKPVDEPPSEFMPGDINGNGVAYEIADAVMFRRFFIIGEAAFGSHVAASIAATDCNLDGIALGVADYVYLVRVVVGDALPYSVPAPPVATYYSHTGGVVNVEGPMGAVLLVVEGTNVSASGIGRVYVEQGIINGDTHVFVTGYDQYSNTFSSFSGDFLNLYGRILWGEWATSDGRRVNASNVPLNFEVFQNYPNPFTSTTKITFNNPYSDPWKVTIYNTVGKKLDQFSGDDGYRICFDWDASHLPTGVYLYIVEACGQKVTMKATLRK